MNITLEKIYSDFYVGEKSAQILLDQMNWFGLIADFDPKTGAALPQSLSAFLAKVAHPEPCGVTRDRLWRITEHCRASVERLFHSLNESPRREHAFLPVHRVRELDANSFIKLSNRPGRTIREKLAGKPYMQAVRRFQSVDLPENRLLKAFVIRLAESLELRRNFLNQEDELLPKIQSWLRSDEAWAIGNWDNLPPNNTLLAHRDYRRVWDAWRWLQTLDDDIARDFSQLETRDKTMRLWQQCARMWAGGKHLFAEIPLLFDYEKFDILPWTSKPPLFMERGQALPRHSQRQDISKPVCVDLTRLRPTYARSDKKAPLSLPVVFLWQQWRREDESVDIELFDSDAAWLHSDATTISSPDLFFAKDNSTEIFDRAARAFVKRARDIFRSDTIIWLVPDFLNNFELEVIRRNINAFFPNAEPLPRSVAAIFAQADPTKITGEGYAIVVIDAIGGKTTAIKVVAKFDKNLEELLPITRGFYWERCPPVIISSTDDEKREAYGYEITTVDTQGQWHDVIPQAKPPFIDVAKLKSDPRIGNFAFCINLTESPVAGGIRLHVLQQQVGHIPLWRDQIPELSIKVMKDGIRQRFDLVSRGTTVIPIRGRPVPISIDEEFTLPAGRPFYQFPLYIDDSADDLGYSARLDSPAFPLNKDAVCDLKLTFEYGADEPYKLIFTPRDKSFPPIRTTWRRTEEIIITDAPAPEYPAPMTWADLHIFPDGINGGQMDLLAKLDETTRNLEKQLNWNNDRAWQIIRKSLKGWCRFLVLSIWRDGRSTLDSDAPAEFKDTADRFKLTLSCISLANNNLISDTRFLEACMHKDAPNHCVDWISKQISGGVIREKRTIGFALGDISEQWQKDVFSRLIENPTNDSLRVLSYAIWRERKLVQKFSLENLRSILNTLKQMLGNIKQCPEKKNERIISNWSRATIEPLELLLGLLRTRASANSEIKMLLQPHQKITKELAKEVERIMEQVVQSNVQLLSRIKLSIQKPTGDRTPDLLYALRLYLTGDDGANAIHISSVSDNDNE